MKFKYIIPYIMFLIPLNQLIGQWVPIGLESEGISSIVVDPHNPSIVYASAIFPADSEGISGIFKSIDGGITWDTIYHGWDMHLAMHPDSSNILYATEWATPVIKTTDGGETWFRSDSGITIGVECCGGGSIAISPNNPEIIYAGTLCTGCGPMWRSSDGGKFWSRSLICATVAGIDPDSSQRAYMGSAMTCDIYRSTDLGSSWLLTGYRSGIAHGFAFGRPSSTVYLASSSGSFLKGIFRSTDAGITWSNIGDGMPGIRSNVNCIVNRRKTHPDDIYIGANVYASENYSDSGAIYGVFRSTDGGDSWISFGLDSIRIQVLSISPDENTLYAGVLFPNYGQRAGIYKRDLVTGVKESREIIQIFRLSQSYPNPQNPTSTITFDLPKLTYVTLVVYNTLGQLVATLIDEQKQPGRYDVQFDGSNLTSGVYFYRLTAGEFVDTKKMIIMK